MKKAAPLAFIGLLLGIPISYYFQPALVQMKFTLPEYLVELPAVFDAGDPKYVIPVILSCLIGAFVFGIVGAFLNSAERQKQPQLSDQVDSP